MFPTSHIHRTNLGSQYANFFQIIGSEYVFVPVNADVL